MVLCQDLVERWFQVQLKLIVWHKMGARHCEQPYSFKNESVWLCFLIIPYDSYHESQIMILVIRCTSGQIVSLTIEEIKKQPKNKNGISQWIYACNNQERKCILCQHYNRKYS